MMLLAMVPLMTDGTHTATSLGIREALGRLTPEIGRLLGAQLRVVIMPCAILAGQSMVPTAALMSGMDILRRSRFGISTGFELHLDTVGNSFQC